MNCFIGVDIGTTGIRAGIYNESFQLLGDGNGKSILIREDDGGIYQKPEDIYTETVMAIREALGKSGISPESVVAFSFDGQMAGIMGIDEHWNPVTPYDSWLDTRCSSELDYIMATARDKIIEKSGIVPSINHAPKILWWKNKRPEVFERISRFIQPAAWIAGLFCGLKAEKAFIDWTYLHFSGLADIEELSWSNELLEIFEIPLDKLPVIVSPFSVIGTLNREMAGVLGVPSGIPVAAGCGDAASCFLGAGGVKEGVAIDIGGTASVFSLTTNRMVVDYSALVYSSRAVSTNLWHVMSYINGGGQNLEWFVNNFARSTEFDRLNKEAEKLNPGCDGLVFVPHLEGRAYPPQPDMRGTWVGFTRKHNLYHFYRSILEGIGFEYLLYKNRILELIPGIKVSEVRAVGGGAKSDLWNKIKADILGVEYKTINREDIAILGQAFIGAKVSGVIEDVQEVVEKVIRIEKLFSPDVENHRLYTGLFEKYLKSLDLSLI